MRFAVALILASLALTACHEASSQRAEQEFKLVEKSGSALDKCDSASRVEQAYLHEQNEAQYKFWHNIRTQACTNARLEQNI
jgi:hypothetical protein